VKDYRSSILSIFDQDLIIVDGVGYWIIYFSCEHRGVVPDIFHGVILGWFIVGIGDKSRDWFFLLFLFSLFKGSFPVIGKWRVKRSKLLWVFFFFN